MTNLIRPTLLSALLLVLALSQFCAAHAAEDASPQASVWQFTSQRWTPWATDRTIQVVIPLKSTCTAGTQLVTTPAYLSTGQDTARVTAARCTGTNTVTLRVTSLDESATYRGTVPVTPDSAGTIKLTIRQTDAWVWPAGVTILGILVSLLIRRWSVLTTVRACWRHIGDATARMTATAGELDDPGIASALRDVVAQRSTALRRSLLGVAAAHPLSLSDSALDYVNVRTDVDAFLEAAQAWEHVADALAALAIETDRLRTEEIPRPHAALPLRPAFLAGIEDTLGDKNVDEDNLHDKARDILAAKKLITLWSELNLRAVDLRARYDDISRHHQPAVSFESPSPQGSTREPVASIGENVGEAARALLPIASAWQVSPLDQAWTAFSAAVTRLWLRSDYRKVDPAQIASWLDAAHDALDQVALARPYEKDLIPDLFPGGEQAIGGFLHPPAAPAPATPPLWLIPAVWRAGDALVIVALAGAAVLTGMLALYVGEPFGGLVDYLSLAGWGLGAQAAIDAIAAVIDRAALARATPTVSSPLGGHPIQRGYQVWR